MRSFLCLVVVSTPLIAGLGCGENPRVAEIEVLDGDLNNGFTLYQENCRSCHGSDGKGAHSMYHGDTLSDHLIETILEGLSGMPSFDHLSNQEIADLVSYIETFD